jgi:GTPase
MKGITSFYPDYVMIVIDGLEESLNKLESLVEETKNYINIAVELRLPITIVVTKSD